MSNTIHLQLLDKWLVKCQISSGAPVLLQPSVSASEVIFRLGREGISQQDLVRQVLLHLPRFSVAEISQNELIENEINRLAEKLILLRQNVPKDFKIPEVVMIDLHRTRLDYVDPSIAELVHQSYHYLGSFRGDGIHLGLYSDLGTRRRSRLLSIVTLSPLDMPHIIMALPSCLYQDEVLVLSRLFAFDWCPRNTISFTIGRVFSWLRERMPHVKMLITYLNPSLGFLGTVYKATNWVFFGREQKKCYFYFDSNYITDRHIIKTYGIAGLKKLRAIFRNRLSRSVLPLQPLEIYAYFLYPEDRKKNRRGFDHIFCPVLELLRD